MKIVIFNLHKNKYAAENVMDAVFENIKQIQNKNVSVRSFDNTGDIVEFDPDFIFSYSHLCPKFCHIPTYLIAAQPVSENLSVEYHQQCYQTFDGYLTQSGFIAKALRALCLEHGKKCHVLEPYTHATSKTAYKKPNLDNLKLVYVGNNWEVKVTTQSPRFKKLFTHLSQKTDAIEFYGDPEGWKWLKQPKLIKGMVSFSDTDALINLYNQQGVGLALSSHPFYEENVVNNRIYEITSSGAVCIADDLPFYKEHFGDSLLYINSRDEIKMSEQILTHLNWIQNNKKAALAKSKKAHEIFCKKLSAEVMLEKLIAFHHEVQQKNYYVKNSFQSKTGKKPLVSVVVRSGGRDEKKVAETLDSIANQSYDNFEVIFILYKKNLALEQLAQTYQNKFSKLIVTQASSYVRSTVMWEGLNLATGDYISVLDDDDIWYKNHTAKILEFFDDHPDTDFVHAGKAYHQEDKKYAFPIKLNINFVASQEDDLLFHLKNESNSTSQYCLGGFKTTNYQKLLILHEAIALCFFVKRASLPEMSLLDPGLHYGEDFFLYAFFYQQGLKFGWLPELTMQINIHGDSSKFHIAKDPYGVATDYYALRDTILYRVHEYNQSAVGIFDPTVPVAMLAPAAPGIRTITKKSIKKILRKIPLVKRTYFFYKYQSIENVGFWAITKKGIKKILKKIPWVKRVHFFYKHRSVRNPFSLIYLHFFYVPKPPTTQKTEAVIVKFSVEDKRFLALSVVSNDIKISFVASVRYSGNRATHNLKSFFDSLIQNTHNLDCVEIIIGVDRDDDVAYYVHLKRQYREQIKNIRIYVCDQSHGHAGLYLYDKFLYTQISPSTRMIADFADDCTIVKKDWDLHLLNVDQKMQDNIYFIHTNDINLEKYIRPLENNITKMTWRYKALAPPSYFPIFSRKVLDITTEYLETLDAKQQKLWSPIANTYMCNCCIAILTTLLQSKVKTRQTFFSNIINGKRPPFNITSTQTFVDFDKDISLFWEQQGLNVNDTTFLKTVETDTIKHLQPIATRLAEEIQKTELQS